jgi:putative oxidoreductase
MISSIISEPKPSSFTGAQAWTLLLLRVSMAPLFLYSGYGKLVDIAGTAARLPGGVEGLGLPMAIGATTLELTGALALVVGFFVRPAALAFIVYIALASVMFHNFWASPPAIVVSQTLNFMKNFGLIGGMSIIAAFGAGPYRLLRI